MLKLHWKKTNEGTKTQQDHSYVIYIRAVPRTCCGFSRGCFHVAWSNGESSVQPPKWSPNPKRFPNRPRNDLHFSSCRPQSDPQGIREWWLNMGRWIAFSFFVEMLQSCHFFLFFRSFELKKTVCRVTASFQSRSSLVPVDLFSLMQCFEPRGLSSSSVLCFTKRYFGRWW